MVLGEVFLELADSLSDFHRRVVRLCGARCQLGPRLEWQALKRAQAMG